MIDDENFDGILGGNELDAERLFQRADERGSIGSAVGASVAQRRPSEVLDVDVAGEAGVVDDGTVPGIAADDAGQHLHFDGAR